MRDLKFAMSNEWITTNGRGGYSSSTVIGMNTRKYHGLLISPRNPPWDRRLFLSKLEEEITIGGKTFELSTNEYPGTIHPKGYEHQLRFEYDPIPSFYFSLNGISLKKSIFMPYWRNAVVVSYTLRKNTEDECKFCARPLINNRKIDEIATRDPWQAFVQSPSSYSVEISLKKNDEPFLFMGSDRMIYRASNLSEEDRWYSDMEYEKERNRGFSFREDHYNPGSFEIILKDEQEKFNFLASAGAGSKRTYRNLYSQDPSKFEKLRLYTLARLNNLLYNFSSYSYGKEDPVFKSLLRASDSFLVMDESVIAGYHWFSTWGRDSLISIPGLALVLGRFEEAKKALLTMGKRERNGLIPNRVGVSGSEYNSADAALLYFYCLYKYLTYTGDLKLAKRIKGVLDDILEGFFEGADGRVQVDKDGLVWCSEGMSWMDARVSGKCVTPREGKPVEINALWYNALVIYDILSEKLGFENEWNGICEKVRDSFVRNFWDSDRGYLYDVVNGGFKDSRNRPNQIFALSLPFPVLGIDKANSLLSVIKKELLTSYGLRSLSKNSKEFRESYGGNMKDRDKAYHQGTVWTWLWGPYLTALRKFGGKGEVEEFAEEILKPFLDRHLGEHGLGTVAEVFDGDEPYRPGGCISQAWSVAELIRAYVEDFKGIRPQFEEEYM